MAGIFWTALILCSRVNAAPPATEGPTAAQPDAPEQIRALLADRTRPVTWVFTGDSITHGAKHTGGCRSYVEHFAERVRWEMGRGQDVVINTGLSGDRAEGLLHNFEPRIGRFKPDVVSLMIGMNDCTGGPEKREDFRRQLRELVQRARRLGAAVMLHTQNPIESSGPGAKERVDVAAYSAIVREVAREQHTLLVDHWGHWQAACAQPAELKSWLNDPIHPNARGHRELAILTFKALGIYSTNSSFAAPEANPSK